MSLTKKIGEEEAKNPTHVDEFIEYGSDICSKDRAANEDYARWVLNHFRLSAICKNAFSEFMKPFRLFCEYRGVKYRVIGASRLGDIWLTSDFTKEHGYEHRVCVDDCSSWNKS